MKSFDVFDTLLARRHFDSDIVYAQLESWNHKGFAAQRKSYDNGARSIRQIYEAMAADGIIQANEVDKYINDEVALEQEHSFPIKETLLLVQNGDLLISDMYLDPANILRMVRSVGMDKQVTIYQSNDGKRSGRFWQQMKDQLKLECHIGDNHQSDVDNAIAHGFNAIHYPKATKLSTVETLLMNYKQENLAKLVREVRLSNHEPNDAYVFEIASQLNLPWLFICCEMLTRWYRDRNIVFLGRDCQLMQKIYHHFYQQTSYYLPFSRQAATDPLNAITYLKSQASHMPVYVDISSTGATWQKLAANLEVCVMIYSDVYHYTKDKPILPVGFTFCSRNSEIGPTNEVLEIFNCGDHGKLESIEVVNGVPLTHFGVHEIHPSLVNVIHKPVNTAIALEPHYRDISGDLGQLPAEHLLQLFKQLAISICANQNVLAKVEGYLQKDRDYTLTVA